MSFDDKAFSRFGWDKEGRDLIELVGAHWDGAFRAFFIAHRELAPAARASDLSR